jgi:hypothetical protein
MQQSHSPRKRAVTMRDVARLANVSQSTVSRVLNDTEDGIPIGEETRQRVMEAVETLGYYPNLYAGTLRGQKSFMLAMMVADIANPILPSDGACGAGCGALHRYDVMIANTDHTRDGEMTFHRISNSAPGGWHHPGTLSPDRGGYRPHVGAHGQCDGGARSARESSAGRHSVWRR